MAEPAPPLLTAPTADRRRLANLGRSQVTRAGLAGVVARGVGVCVSFIIVALASHSLPRVQFGAWLTVTGIIVILGLVDFGLGNATITPIAQALAAGDADGACAIYSSSVAAQGIVSLLFIVVAVAALQSPAVVHLLVPGVPLAVGHPLLLVLTVGLAGGAVASIGTKAWWGQQRGSVPQLANIVVSVLQVAGSIGAAADSSLVLFAVSLVLPPVVVNGCLSAALRRGLSPVFFQRRAVSLATARRSARAGFAFFGLAVLGAIAYQTDALIIAHLLGTARVSDYAIPYRLFMLVPSFVGLLLLPYWPAYAEAEAQGRQQWVRKTIGRTFRFSMTANLLSGACLVILAPAAAHLWVGHTAHLSLSMDVAMLAFVAVNGLSGPVGMYMNGMHFLRFQLVTSSCMAVANVFLSIVLTPSIGVAGPVWGTVISQTLCILVPTLIFMYRRTRQ